MLIEVCPYEDETAYIDNERGQLIIKKKDFDRDRGYISYESNKKEERASSRNTKSYGDNTHLVSLTLNISEVCNMRCTYCFADEGTYGNTTGYRIMKKETLHKLLTKLLDYYPHGIKSFCFFGGEPLIYPENLFELANTILKEYENRGLSQPVFSINTNGTIMPDRVIKFLNQYQVLTTISIDGLKPYHDKHRIMKDGTGSYDKIVNNLRKLEDRKFKLTAEVTVNKSLIDGYKPGISKMIVDNIMDLGFDDFALFPVDSKLEHNSARYTQVLSSIDKLFEEYSNVVFKYFLSRNDYIRLPSHIVSKIISIIKRKKRRGCGAGKLTLFANVFGQIYPCQLYYSARADDYEMSQLEELAMPNIDSIAKCSNCFASYYCSSWCSGSVINFNGYYNSVIETRCAAERAIQRTIIANLLDIRNSKKEFSLLIKRLKKFASIHSYQAYIGTGL